MSWENHVDCRSFLATKLIIAILVPISILRSLHLYHPSINPLLKTCDPRLSLSQRCPFKRHLHRAQNPQKSNSARMSNTNVPTSASEMTLSALSVNSLEQECSSSSPSEDPILPVTSFHHITDDSFVGSARHTSVLVYCFVAGISSVSTIG